MAEMKGGQGGRPTEVFIVIVHDDSRNYFVEWEGAENNLPKGVPAGLILGFFSYGNNTS
jgi:hypothetical protein